MQGSRDAIAKLSPALAEADPALLGKVEAGINSVYETMAPLRRGEGWASARNSPAIRRATPCQS